MTAPYLLELPVPPALSAYYLNATRKVKNGPKEGKKYMGKMISPAGLAFRGEVNRRVRMGHRTPPKFKGRLRIVVYVCKAIHTESGAVRNSRSDLDNLWKCLLDALTKAEVIGDDCLFDDERMVRGNNADVGRVWVSIMPADPVAALEAVRAAGIDPDANRAQSGMPF